MPIALRGLNNTFTSDTMHALSLKSFADVTLAASVANTVVQTASILPFNYKIRQVAVMFTTIDSTAGTDSFNLVVGGLAGQTGQAYTQGNISPNDTFDITGVNGPTAALGMAVFGADVPFNAATANLAASNTAGYAGNQQGQAVPNTGWLTITTTGGYGLFVPTDYDAVYPAGVPLSLRATTTTGTGAIGHLIVAVSVVPVPKRRATAGVAGQGIVLPATDY